MFQCEVFNVASNFFLQNGDYLLYPHIYIYWFSRREVLHCGEVGG
jgi:hypothetical protein